MSEQLPFDQTELLIQQELNALVRDSETFHSDIDWTRSLKERMQKLGSKLGYEVRTTDPNKGTQEWLYDIVWLSKTPVRTIKEVVLVMESEWNQGGAETDFDKLLVARARYRVMAFTGKKSEKFFGSIERLRSRLVDFAGTSKGDRYMFAAWADEKKRFEYGLHVCS
jgi:hypothetical protein